MADFEYSKWASLEAASFTMLMVNTTDGAFTFENAPDNADSLALVEVKKLPVCHYPGREREIPFSLSFRAKCALPQGQYRLRHETVGEFELFLMPNGPRSDGFAMSAGFT